MNWTDREYGNVKAINHSTACVIQLIVTEKEQDVQGGEFIETKEEFWFNYGTWDDLKKVLIATE
ncbi:hypothetical protein LCGC14_1479760 [marine sediment metagenome]|uniref:Uncharacterized protein n=1 Tax=marine sediment metagenome TaxID=412755 RepID=A0A0F9JUW3_9ZZZZ